MGRSVVYFRKSPLIPAIFSTKSHSSAETGCTESREYLTSTMSFSDWWL